MTLDLPTIWAGLIALAVLAYMLLDGFDLGLGMLFAVEHREEDRDVMVNTIAPVWDGNETWLVLGGGGLLAVFPLAYAVIMPAMYPTIIAMLLALVFRGVAFEFRFARASRCAAALWDLAFFVGSLRCGVLARAWPGRSAARHPGAGPRLCRRLVGLVDRRSACCAARAGDRLCVAGPCWLIWRTEGALQTRARDRARALGDRDAGDDRGGEPVDADCSGQEFMLRWYAGPTSCCQPGAGAGGAGRPGRSGAASAAAVTPFLCAQAWFVLCYMGLGISLWPMMVPPSITIYEAAAPPASQLFLLVGAWC